jgi:hypothetical protein
MGGLRNKPVSGETLNCLYGFLDDECDGHTVHKLSQRRLTADLLAPRESDFSRMHNKVSSGWLDDKLRQGSRDIQNGWILFGQTS